MKYTVISGRAPNNPATYVPDLPGSRCRTSSKADRHSDGTCEEELRGHPTHYPLVALPSGSLGLQCAAGLEVDP